MAKQEPNLKVNLGVDASGMTKGASKAKAELKALEKETGNVTKGMASALGIPIERMESLSSAIGGIGQKMQKASSESTRHLGEIVTSLGRVGGAVAGLGIGAAVSAFKLLNAEATAYKNTMEGAEISVRTQAYIETYKQALHDINSDAGKSFAETEANAEKSWARFTSRLGSIATRSLTGENGSFTEGWWKALTPVYGTVNFIKGISSSIKDINSHADELEEKAETASDIAGDIYKLEARQSEELKTIAQLNADIAEQKRIASEDTSSTLEKTQAIAKAEDLINQKYSIQSATANEMATLYERMNGINESSKDQIDKANNLRSQAISLVAQQEQELKALARQQRSVNSEAARETEERAKALEAQRQQMELAARYRQQLTEYGRIMNSVGSGNVDTGSMQTPRMTVTLDFDTGKYTESLNKMYKDAEDFRLKLSSVPPVLLGWAESDQKPTIKYNMEIDPSSRQNLVEEVKITAEQMQSVWASAVESMGSSIGNLFADLATGDDAWNTFANSAVSAFGDMAIAIGKLAISTGMATIGIKAALESLNGYAAIAAGVALVALGTAVKSSMSNIASGSYSSSVNVASSSYQGTGNIADMYYRDRDVKVTGTLRADGSQLVAVINNENNRRSHTT